MERIREMIDKKIDSVKGISRMQFAAEILLEAFSSELGLDLNDVNFKDTPARMARMYKEIFSGVKDTQSQVDAILNSAFPCDNNQLILMKDIDVYSMCPHHLLPVHYNIHVAYIPGKDVVGLSKLVRLVELLAKRPVLQEQLVEDVSTNLMKIDGAVGAACIAEGVHLCMAMRGIKKHAKTVTSSLKGVFLEGGDAKAQQARQELMSLLK